MGFRIVFTMLCLSSGLYAGFQALSQERWAPPTIWFKKIDVLEMPLSSEFRTEIAARYERDSVRRNQLYAAHLREQRRRLALAWSLTPTLVGIVTSHNPSLGQEAAREIAQAIEESSDRHSMDPLLIAALIAQESRFRPQVVSPGGAVGLGQILPSTAATLGVNPYRASDNIEGCARYLAALCRRWKYREDKTELALASYNAGPGAVEKYGGIPPYRITQRYVAKIMARRDRFQALVGEKKDRWIAQRLRNVAPGPNGLVLRDLDQIKAEPGRPLPGAQRARPSS